VYVCCRFEDFGCDGGSEVIESRCKAKDSEQEANLNRFDGVDELTFELREFRCLSGV